MKRSEILNRTGITPPPDARIRLIVDTDAKNEADDQYVIMHHLLTPMFDVRGIIATHFEQKAKYGGRSMEASYEEIERVLRLAEIDDVPCLRGCASPLKSADDAPDSEAVRFIIQEARKPGKLYIAQQAALTNTAAAINAAPDIAENLVVLWNGGGPYPAGRPEFNVMQGSGRRSRGAGQPGGGLADRPERLLHAGGNTRRAEAQGIPLRQNRSLSVRAA